MWVNRIELNVDPIVIGVVEVEVQTSRTRNQNSLKRVSHWKRIIQFMQCCKALENQLRIHFTVEAQMKTWINTCINAVIDCSMRDSRWAVSQSMSPTIQLLDHWLSNHCIRIWKKFFYINTGLKITQRLKTLTTNEEWDQLLVGSLRVVYVLCLTLLGFAPKGRAELTVAQNSDE